MSKRQLGRSKKLAAIDGRFFSNRPSATFYGFDLRFRARSILVAGALRLERVEKCYGRGKEQDQIPLEKLDGASRLQPIRAPASGGGPSAEFKSNTIDFEKIVLRAKE